MIFTAIKSSSRHGQAQRIFSYQKFDRSTFVFYRKYHTKDIFGVKPFSVRSNHVNEFIINRIVVNDRNHSYISQFVDEFRSKGHFLASINPLKSSHETEFHEETSLLRHFIDGYKGDLTEINCNDYLHLNLGRCNLSTLTDTLERIYCSNVGLEFMHLNNPGEREWLAAEWERIALNSDQIIDEGAKLKMAELIWKSELFDRFVGTKFPTLKRYSGEGAESMLPCLYSILKDACTEYGVRSAIVGMPHRGRLNALELIFDYPTVNIFRKMSGHPEIDFSQASFTGDVLSHLFLTTKLSYKLSSLVNNGEEQVEKISVSLLPNPSHLEVISPVVCGKARSKAMRATEGPYGSENCSPLVLPVQVHGDASFTGQGIVMETLSMSSSPSFTVNGSIHLIINNQIGYTTPSHVGRSSVYCSDIMKMIDSPCIHVNGDNPEDVLKVSKLALKYRQTFGKDIAIDLMCFRHWGHNELDDPTMTNPIMYKAINSRLQTLPNKIAREILGEERMSSLSEDYTNYLSGQFKNQQSYIPTTPDLKGVWSSCKRPQKGTLSIWETGVPKDVLLYVGKQSVKVPKSFHVHENVKKVFVEDRLKRLAEEDSINWSTAEALALGSLQYQGYNIRISGQDVGRGTFSQRHAMLVDQESGKLLIPLNGLSRGSLELANSILSEEAVLGFEYGFAIDSPNNLVIWEAQFGDFFNGAQAIFDTLISSGEAKWLFQCGIIILLPHGYDGAGPDHSSCRPERFLQMSDSRENQPDDDNINWHICNPTTPAQYFHLIRRQLVRNYRKPLVLVSPKVLLRHPSCISHLDHLTFSHFFQPVLPDSGNIDDLNVKRIIFCSGKHFYTLYEERNKRRLANVALIRLEELCPFPLNDLHLILRKYPFAKEFFWSQEEHRNMGAWSFVQPRFKNLLNLELKYAGREFSASTATGIAKIHREESERLIKESFGHF